jgi:hypothetical protein
LIQNCKIALKQFDLWAIFINHYACWINFQVTAFPPYGGIVFPFAIGAVVVGDPTTFQTPLSGQFSPVFAVVPIGFLICL